MTCWLGKAENQPCSIPEKSKGLRQWRPDTVTAMAVWKIMLNSLFLIFYILIVLWNSCIALLNFKCSNPFHRQGNATIKIQQKYQCSARTNSRLACLSSVLYQQIVILYRPYLHSCQLYFVYLAVFLLSPVLLDNDWICGTWRPPSMKPWEIFEVD